MQTFASYLGKSAGWMINLAALGNINLSGPAGILWLGLNSGSKTTNFNGIFLTSKAALGIYSAVWIAWHKYPLICTGVVWDHIDNSFDRWSLGTFLQKTYLSMRKINN